MIPILPFIVAGVAGVASAAVQIASAVKNKRFLEKQIEEERIRRLELLEENKRRYALIMGQQTAGFAASGLELVGTPQDVLGDTEVQQARNEGAIRRESRQRIQGIRNMISQQNQAIFGAVLGGVTSVAGAAQGYQMYSSDLRRTAALRANTEGLLGGPG